MKLLELFNTDINADTTNVNSLDQFVSELCNNYEISDSCVYDKMFLGLLDELEKDDNLGLAITTVSNNLLSDIDFYDIDNYDDESYEDGIYNNTEIDEASTRLGKPGKKRKKIYKGQSSATLANYVARRWGGTIGCSKASQIINDPNINNNIKKRAIWYKSLHCKGRKQVR